jgi:fatty-acyl-CoA synthase
MDPMSVIDRPWPTNLREGLRRAARDARGRGIAVFDGRGRHVDRRSYGQLLELATSAAGRFAALGVGAREPVLVALPTSWEWLEAWFGLVMLGAWPVATSGAGAMAAAEAQFEKVTAVLDRLGARFVVASRTFGSQAAEQGFEAASRSTLTVERLAASCEMRYDEPTADGDDLAFLQLTSGSTGSPRAVMISHRAAIHNPLASIEAIGAPRGAPADEWADAMVSWLPLYHDMGLIGCLVLPLLAGLDTWLFRPQTFLARPGLWLEHLGRHGTTFTPAPNFGYQLCVERLQADRLEGVDLRGWRSALTGAEMIRPETTTAFCEAFARHGFEPTAFQPCYGLAESTLAVTFDTAGRGIRALKPPDGADTGFGISEVVSTGGPIRDTSLRIAAPDGRELPESTVGEVWVKGPGVFDGYFNDPEATAASLRDGWLATGDLGFLSGGELYLTGRSKEVLILRGHNIMPEEIERVADGVTGGGGLMRSAAFSIARGTAGEEAVVVVEIDGRDPQRASELGHEIRVRIGRSLGLPLADLVFVRRGRIPRTTSGKMQRGELRAQYLAGTLETL